MIATLFIGGRLKCELAMRCKYAGKTVKLTERQILTSTYLA